jgi:hypothetical protein
LIEAILTLPWATFKEEMLRQTEAINAIATYCLFEEGNTCRLPQATRSAGRACNAVKKEEDNRANSERKPPDASQEGKLKLFAAMRSVMTDKRPQTCFICVCNPNLDLDKCTQVFKTHGDVTKHIKRKHMKNIKEGDPIDCGLCKLPLAHKMHLQRHAIEVHSTVT